MSALRIAMSACVCSICKAYSSIESATGISFDENSLWVLFQFSLNCGEEFRKIVPSSPYHQKRP